MMDIHNYSYRLAEVKSSLTTFLDTLNKYSFDVETHFEVDFPYWVCTLVNKAYEKISLSIHYEYNGSKGTYCYYFGLGKDKTASILLENKIIGLDYVSSLDEIVKLIPDILDHYFLIPFYGFYSIPPMIIDSNDLKEAKNAISSMINDSRAYIEALNFTGCARADFYQWNGEHIKSLIPKQQKFREVSSKETVKRIYASFWIYNDPYLSKCDERVKIGYLEFDENRTLFIKDEDMQIISEVPFEKIGIFRLGYVRERVFEQILDVNNNPIVTIFDADTWDEYFPKMENYKRILLYEGTKQYTSWVNSFSNGYMLDTGKSNAYISDNFYNYLFNK